MLLIRANGLKKHIISRELLFPFKRKMSNRGNWLAFYTVKLGQQNCYASLDVYISVRNHIPSPPSPKCNVSPLDIRQCLLLAHLLTNICTLFPFIYPFSFNGPFLFPLSSCYYTFSPFPSFFFSFPYFPCKLHQP
jgi:hypothetical protein